MKDYSLIPTFCEFSDRGWTTKKGKSMISWTALVVARNGVMLARRTRNAIKGVPPQYRDKKRLSKTVRRELAASRRQEALIGLPC